MDWVSRRWEAAESGAHRRRPHSGGHRRPAVRRHAGRTDSSCSVRRRASSGWPTLEARPSGWLPPSLTSTSAHPSLLRGGEVLLYTRARAGTASGRCGDRAGGDGHARRGMSSPAAAQMGDISRPGTSSTAGPAICLALPVRPARRLRASGTPVVLVSGVGQSTSAQSGSAHFGFSETGTLAYVSAALPEARLTWLDLQGREQTHRDRRQRLCCFHVSRPRTDRASRSPTGTEQGNIDIFIRDLARQTTIASDYSPGHRYGSALDARRHTRDLRLEPRRRRHQYLLAARPMGLAPVERLTRANTQQPYAVTPDGETLIYPEFVVGSVRYLHAMALNGDRTPRALLKSPFNERRPAYLARRAVDGLPVRRNGEI